MPFPRVKGQMYEQDFHLPMAACWTDRALSGRRIDDIVSFVDIAPTLIEIAGGTGHHQFEGKSLLDLILSTKSGIVDTSRNKAYFCREKQDLGRENDMGYPVRCIRTMEYLYVRNYEPDRWPAGNPETNYTNCDSSPTKDLILRLHENGNDKYYRPCFGKRPGEELYDIISDPECMRNLSLDDEYKEINLSLRSELEKKLRDTGDPRIFGNGYIFESYPDVSADKSHSWKAYKEGWWNKQIY
jgi:arylsulfatase A-like enzyme